MTTTRSSGDGSEGAKPQKPRKPRRSTAKARRERSPIAIAASEIVIAETRVRCPRDIRLDLIAGFYEAYVVYGPLEREDAHVLHAGGRGIIRIAERDRDFPRGRHSGFHELGHFRMHAAIDHFARCTSGGETERRGTPYRLEQEANDFAALSTMPEFLIGPMCREVKQPGLVDVGEVGEEFGTSLTSTAIRYAELSGAACAVVMSENGVIKWRVCSDRFVGRPIRGHQVDPRTRAAGIFRGEVDARGGAATAEGPWAIAGDAWAAWDLGGGEVLEESVKLGELPKVLTWLWHRVG